MVFISEQLSCCLIPVVVTVWARHKFLATRLKTTRPVRCICYASLLHSLRGLSFGDLWNRSQILSNVAILGIYLSQFRK